MIAQSTELTPGSPTSPSSADHLQSFTEQTTFPSTDQARPSTVQATSSSTNKLHSSTEQATFPCTDQVQSSTEQAPISSTDKLHSSTEHITSTNKTQSSTGRPLVSQSQAATDSPDVTRPSARTEKAMTDPAQTTTAGEAPSTKQPKSQYIS